MENSKRGMIPMQEKLKFSKSQGALTPTEIERMQNIPYASAVGSIMYAIRCTHPDVAFAQNITSQFHQNPDDVRWTTVKNTLKYLHNTKDMFLVYGGDTKQELKVSCYTDAGYLMDADDMKSQTGYVFVLNGGAVDWKSTKQSIFATSSTNAEYIAAFDASKKAFFSLSIEFDPKPSRIFDFSCSPSLAIQGCAKFEARMAIMGDDDIPIVVSFLLMGTCQVSICLAHDTGSCSQVLDCHQNVVEKNRETLSYQKALNAEQERDVERVRQRDKLLSKLKYDMKKSEYLKVKDQEKEAKQKMEGATKTLNDIREPIEYV
ncbi:hypothetical protein Tco_0005931 [Tanacetum coccineum]